MDNEGTKRFIQSCLKNRNSGFLNEENESNPDLKTRNPEFLNIEERKIYTFFNAACTEFCCVPNLFNNRKLYKQCQEMNTY